jgi:hypothetical protein
MVSMAILQAFGANCDQNCQSDDKIRHDIAGSETVAYHSYINILYHTYAGAYSKIFGQMDKSSQQNP